MEYDGLVVEKMGKEVFGIALGVGNGWKMRLFAGN